MLSPYFHDTLCEAQTLPSGKSGVMILMLHPHNKGNPTPSASMEEQNFVVVCAGGECGCVNPLVPVHAALVGTYI